ncbi:MAG TPA: aspartyl-phosphate phosphatase Spo0E family protein [Metabacillus sp.]|nr:aspartyl-phosphate phosphatase Spo0E family protein [Metabacillus sp.]
MKTLDTVIEEYRNKMFLIAKEDGLNSHQTLIASQHLDELLNIKMAESKSIDRKKDKHQ